MPKVDEYVPVKPFMDWLNQRFDFYLADAGGSLTNGQIGQGPAMRVCEEIGWGYSESAARRLFRYRRGITEVRPGGRKGNRRTIPAAGYDRRIVEDALHHAGVDFFDLYPEYAHERDGAPEPEAWCPNCQDHVLVVRETYQTRKLKQERERLVCAWCSWKMSDGHLNGLQEAA